ncbi:MAG TPA: energy transducer TonB [Terriglobales bacterium]|nr:energy transducer TonB [Terriglobales bacterium]
MSKGIGMRIHKLGSRFLRVVTSEGRVRYFSTSGFSAFRLFWIFRNFGSLDDRVLSARQLRIIQGICSGAEVRRELIDLSGLIGTLELSSAGSESWNAPEVRQSIHRLQVDVAEAATPRSFQVPSFVLSATALIVCALLLVIVLANRNVRRQLISLSSRSIKITESLLPQTPRSATARQQFSEQPPPQPQLVSVALPATKGTVAPNTQLSLALESTGSDDSEGPLLGVGNRVALQRASLRIESLINSAMRPGAESHNLTGGSTTPARQQLAVSAPLKVSGVNTAAIASSTRRPHPLTATAETLPPSGPPQSHPVLAEFPSVSKDTQVILRAIVSPDGRVARVNVVEGNPNLARQAAHAVTSWRYSARAGSGNTESRILFRFAPDVTTVSFLDPGASKISR